MRLHRTVAPSRGPWWRLGSIVTGGAASVVAALVAIGGFSGCSVLYGLETAQCDTNADCDELGGVFTGLACENHVCVQPIISGCQSNAECMDTVGNSTEPYICRNRECIALLTPECPTILPQTNDGWRTNLRTANPLILAGTGQIGGTTSFDERLQNYDLALTEFTSRATGLQGGSRPLVMLGCKADYESPEELDRMMTHLVDTVKVPGFLAQMGPSDLQRAFVEKGRPANMFFMSPGLADPTLTALPDRGGLLWFVGPTSDGIARTYAPLLKRAIAHLGLTEPVRVATVVTSDNRFASQTLSAITASPAQYGIAFNSGPNGGSVFDNIQSGNYLGLSIAGSDTSASAQLQSLLDFKPHIIISAASDSFVANIMRPLENSWAASVPDQAPPFYLLSPFNVQSTVLDGVVSSTPTVRTRLAGVNGTAPPMTDDAYMQYTVAWNRAFPTSSSNYENFYDAAWYLIYAAVGAGQFITNDGQDFLRGMARLLSGREYTVGERDIAEILATLGSSSSATITLNAVLGPPDFNLIDGTRAQPGSVWCFNSANQPQYDVLRYVENDDPTLASLSGTFSCFPNF